MNNRRRQRSAKQFLYVPEGSYKRCKRWFPLVLSARLTKHEAEAELRKRKPMYDYTVWRIGKFRRAQ
jgi:hypothetical protein